MTSDERESLQYVSSALDDVRKALEIAQSAATTALAWVRIQQMRANDEEGENA